MRVIVRVNNRQGQVNNSSSKVNNSNNINKCKEVTKKGFIASSYLSYKALLLCMSMDNQKPWTVKDLAASHSVSTVVSTRNVLYLFLKILKDSLDLMSDGMLSQVCVPIYCNEFSPILVWEKNLGGPPLVTLLNP